MRATGPCRPMAINSQNVCRYFVTSTFSLSVPVSTEKSTRGVAHTCSSDLHRVWANPAPTQPRLVPPARLSRIDDGNDRPAALRALMHGVDRHEHRRIADCRRRYAAHRRLGMAVVVHIGVVEHDLAAPAQGASTVGLALYETVHRPAFEILGARARRQIEPCVANRLVDAVDVERVSH